MPLESLREESAQLSAALYELTDVSIEYGRQTRRRCGAVAVPG